MVFHHFFLSLACYSHCAALHVHVHIRTSQWPPLGRVQQCITGGPGSSVCSRTDWRQMRVTWQPAEINILPCKSVVPGFPSNYLRKLCPQYKAWFRMEGRVELIITQKSHCWGHLLLLHYVSRHMFLTSQLLYWFKGQIILFPSCKTIPQKQKQEVKCLGNFLSSSCLFIF